MNIKALTLSIISVAAAVAASSPAQAQEAEQRRPSARWDFQPNVWRKEEIRMPRGYNAPSAPVAVKSGAVPGKSMLGLDPAYLAKAPAPMPAPLVRVNQNLSAVPFPKPNPSPLEAFQRAFGKPVSAAPTMLAAAPQGLSAAPASTMPSAARQVSAHRIPTRSHNTGLTGKLLTPQHRPTPVPAVANYGSLGFTPGAYTPTAGSSGNGANTSVSARLYRH